MVCLSRKTSNTCGIVGLEDQGWRSLLCCICVDFLVQAAVQDLYLLIKYPDVQCAGFHPEVINHLFCLVHVQNHDSYITLRYQRIVSEILLIKSGFIYLFTYFCLIFLTFLIVLPQSDDECIERDLAETVFGIYVIRHNVADPDDDPEDIGIVLEGVEVLSGLRNVPFAMAMFLGLVYALNISYPPELKYTFEALQKIIMEMQGNRLSAKVQTLKTLLAR